jgi:hypothetical protein
MKPLERERERERVRAGENKNYGSSAYVTMVTMIKRDFVPET